MKSAKDYGFNEGYLLTKGSVAPVDHVSVGDVNDKQSLIIPTQIIDTEISNYTSAVGGTGVDRNPEGFAKSFAASREILNATGITRTSSPNTVQVGVDFEGNKIYSQPQLANNTSKEPGKSIAQMSGIALGTMGAFTDYKETGDFISIGDHAADDDFHAQLDGFKSNQDPKAFVKALARVGGGSLDNNTTGYSAYKLYENWGNLSPAQKSIGITGLGMQAYKFSNGDTFETKKLTPDVPGIPSLNASQALTLATQGVNVAPATSKWGQISALQETLFTPKTSSDVVNTANSLGVLGYDVDGKSVATSQEALSTAGVQSAPQYGVGAGILKGSTGVPSGYTVVANTKEGQVIIPAGNASTANINTPDIASDTAYQVYNKWDTHPKGTATQDKGVVGGSALIGGLNNLVQSNPYSAGAVIGHSSFETLPEVFDKTDLGYVSALAGVSLQRLVKGGSSKAIDLKGLEEIEDGVYDEDSHNKAMKAMTGKFAQHGISSKEAGYQLANQAYAEDRLNETQHVAAQKALDLVFDDNSYVLGQKLLTGRGKAQSLTEKRRSN